MIFRAALLALILTAPASAQSLLPRLDRQGWPLPPGAVASLGKPRLKHPGPISEIAFSPDAKLIAAISFEGNIVVYDTATARARFRAVMPIPAEERCLQGCAIAFTPDGARLAVIVPGELRVFDLATDRTTLKRTFITRSDSWFALSPDGRFAVLGSGNSCRQIDLATDIVMREVPIGGEAPYLAQVRAPGLMVFSRGRVGIHDLTTGALRGILPDPWTEDEDWMAPAVSGSIVAHVVGKDTPRLLLRDVRGGPEWPVAPGVEGITNAVFSADGRTLAFPGYEGPVLVDAGTGEALRTMHGRVLVDLLAFSPDGRILAGVPRFIHTRGHEIVLWDTATGQRLPVSKETGHVRPRLQFLDDRRVRIIGTSITDYDWRDGRELRRIPVQQLPDGEPEISRNGSTIAMREEEGTVRVLDSGTGRERFVVRVEEPQFGRRAIFSPDGARLYSADADNGIAAWDARGSRLVAFDRSHPSDALCVRGPTLAVSPDGRALAALGEFGDDGRVLRFWDARDGQLRREFPLTKDFEAFSISFSADGRLAAAMAHDPIRAGGDSDPPPELTEVRVWDWAAGRVIRSLNPPDGQRFLALSPDGRTVAIGFKDGSVGIWEVATGIERSRFAGHHREITSLAFSPDGRYLASTSDEGPAYIWDLFAPLPGLDPRRVRADLANADTAFPTMCRLLAQPDRAIALLREQFRPIEPLPAARVREFLTQLDDRAPAARAAAQAELQRVADQIEPELTAHANAKTTSAEAAHQSRRLLEYARVVTDHLAARLRALEVAERMNTPASRALIAEWSKGAPAARFTREAAAALERMKRQTSP